MCWLAPLQLQVKIEKCWLGLVVMLAGSFTVTGKNRKVLAGVGRHAGWLLYNYR